MHSHHAGCMCGKKPFNSSLRFHSSEAKLSRNQVVVARNKNRTLVVRNSQVGLKMTAIRNDHHPVISRSLFTQTSYQTISPGKAIIIAVNNDDRDGNLEGALPLGAIPGIEFPVLNFNLSATDMLVLMTDGIAEAQNTEGHLFGFDRIAEILRSNKPTFTP
jgi:Stage II sporulation protein E (SpoIIE)